MSAHTQIGAFAARCEKQRARVQTAAFFVVLSRFAWPGLAAVLAVLVTLKLFHLNSPLLIAAPVVWLVVSLVVAISRRQQWFVPGWKVPAFVDRNSGAKGRLMQAVETGHGDAEIPEAAERVLVGHSGMVLTVAITPDGKSAVSGSYDNTLRVWDLASGEELYKLK